MKKLFILLVIIFTVFSCTENGTSGGGSGNSGDSKSNEVDKNIVCDQSLKVLPIDKPIAMIIKEHLSFGRKLFAVYPARVDPLVALENYTYDGVYYAQNTHDYVPSVKYDEIETFNTITEMAKKSVIVTPQILTAKFRVTLTHYSENSNALFVYVRAKGSVDEWKVIMLDGIGTDYVYVETNATGELEYYLDESSFRDWIDDETAEPGVHVYGFVEANIEIDQVYLPFK